MQTKSRFKTIRFLCTIFLITAFHQALNGAALTYQQFADYGVTFGEKEIPVERKRTALKSECSPPTSDAPQRILTVQRPHFVLEKVLKTVAE